MKPGRGTLVSPAAVSGDPAARTFGAFPAADGNPAAYLFAWDEGEQTYLPVEEG